ncbi:unnamed protein product [Fusarium graminearum]|uniref:Uncharacterized protein n=1 Tax=Gibberella zeae TaxID=5518 RepID=A0A4U9FBS3_GIBZA|nr:unnamed protein product [Fusarium graminearum]CAG2010252.1 unnamed protein product [Fusarium graminearum]VTO93851.1 unnamed protein product [Fusarium graminearum]
MSSRPYDITVLGATGWTATICAEHIAKTFPINTEWCIAGRSPAKLEALRQSLQSINPDRLEPFIHVVSQIDEQALDPLVKKSKVIINGIGPYRRYATPIVAACARNGTHYVDFSTETSWISEIIRDYHELAVESGATIIPAIAGSSAPSDLVAWLIVSYLNDHNLQEASEVVCSGRMTMLGMQGGSLHTVLDVAEKYGIGGWWTADTSILLPDTEPVVGTKTISVHRYDRHLGNLATSFVAWGNESVVRRSAVLDTPTYGQKFLYKEYSPAKSYVSAVFIHIITKIGILLLAIPWFRSFLRIKSFSPGEGPDRIESRKVENAEWQAVGYVAGVAEPVAFSIFSFQGALVDMAAILAVEGAATINDRLRMKEGSHLRAGLLTPSTLGGTFVDRLRAAGFSIEIKAPTGADRESDTSWGSKKQL